MPTINPTVSLQQVAPTFNLQPLAAVLQAPLEKALQETGQDRYHASTVLMPRFVIWFGAPPLPPQIRYQRW